ncbi:MAG: hypothetical protein PHF51_01065 [Candidatus ainarchaeum sp.]|nr:hypothetical protein [Candidatus ainarchaeum sp.]
MKTFAAAVFLLLALCGTCHAAELCTLDSEWTQGGGTWISLALSGIMAIMLFLSIVYMSAVLLSRLDWILWVKDEFYQALISFFIIYLVSSLGVIACTATFSLAGGDPFSAARSYLNDLIWQKTLNVAMELFLLAIYASVAGAFFVPVGAPPSGFQPLAGLSAINALLNFLFLLASTLFSSLLLQEILLNLAQAVAFKIVLPMGVFFRVFPFLRTAGAAFIAIGLGAYIVWPMLYVFNGAVVASIGDVGFAYESASDWGQAGGSASVFVGPFAAFNALRSVIQMFAPMEQVQKVAILVPQAVFLPLLDLAILYAFIKSMTKVFSQNFPSPFG